MEKITGISASTGIATANAFLIKKHKLISKNIVFTSVDQEKQILDKSIKSTIEQIEQLELNLNEDIKQEAGKIFAAHKLMVNDPEMIKQTVDIITNESATAFDAYERVSKIFFDIFDSMEDEYMRERAIDVKDISTRVLSNIVGTPLQDISLIKEEVILVANDLTPSQTAQLNKKYIKGFITEIGGETSHSALISRTMGIPAMVGVGSDISKVKNGQLISIDTINSSIYIEPTQEKLGELDTLILKLQHEKEISEKYKNMKSVTLDNKEVMISANISSYKDLELVIENGADGVGLFRTEFLYMESKNWPTEEEQFVVYKSILEKMGDKPVVIRTLDIGGDKKLDYFTFPEEMNPFLGYRAVRMSLDKQDIFVTQVRALLRAAKFGNLSINIPMISTIEEIREIKSIIDKTKDELGNKAGGFKLGIMVEVPSVIEMIPQFSKYVDFFSVGTNDLIQYTFAADRMSEHVSHLYQPLNPTIIRKFRRLIRDAHENGTHVGVCGEMSREPKAVPIFVGLGLDEWSMSANSIPLIRKVISKVDTESSAELTKDLIKLDTAKEVEEKVIKYFEKKEIETI